MQILHHQSTPYYIMSIFRNKSILILAKAYPNPTPKCVESVCSAGIDKTGNYIRLYPVPYRELPTEKKYKKFQWINVDITKSRDHRKESYTPRIDTLTLGNYVPTNNNWEHRIRLIKPYIEVSLEEVDTRKKSLCIIKPYRIEKLIHEPVSTEWPEKWKAVFDQLGMGEQFPKLKKIPYKFSYKYYCSQKCNGHKQQILDWELGALYIKMEKLYGKEIALEKVHNQYFLNICSPEREQYLFLGTILKHPKDWNILSIFWPKRDMQQLLI
ncbi:MAG: hypothetical protein GF403_01865 [Candidatus Coatesbacteria bacterium]|nr:hypothetical protein [Candidatus Coatesbacteria bacterium]